MIEGETLGLWRIFCSWWTTRFIKPVDLILNNRIVAGFHLSHIKDQMPQRYNEALLHLLDLYQKKILKPHIDSIWSFSQVNFYQICLFFFCHLKFNLVEFRF